MEVVIRDSFEKALLIFKRGCAPIIREVRDRRGYLKPCERRKRKSDRAKQREKQRLKRMQGRHERYNERPAKP